MILLGALRVVRQEGKSRKTREQVNIGTYIYHCPKEVKTYQEFEQWDFDTVVSSRG